MTAGTLRSWLDRRPWVWSFAGALLVWGLTAATVAGRGAGETLSTALAFAAFYALVGLGQMLVIASGPGNIDLSIPAVMTLAGYLAMGVMGGNDAGLLPGLAVGLAVGLGAGLANALLILALRIPPMIATLAAGFVIQSMATAYSRGSTAKPAPLLLDLSLARIAGVPLLAVLVTVLAAIAAVVLDRSVFGRSVLAIGQNPRAAFLAGVRIRRNRAAVYLLSALAAALCGVLLAGYSGGAALNMGEDFLLISIAVVVLGGTAIAGGQVAVPGIWGAALFLYLVVTMLNVMQIGIGLRFILTGLIIILVLAVAKGRRTA
jgi:ribose transport system permease protein